MPLSAANFVARSRFRAAAASLRLPPAAGAMIDSRAIREAPSSPIRRGSVDVVGSVMRPGPLRHARGHCSRGDLLESDLVEGDGPVFVERSGGGFGDPTGLDRIGDGAG